MREIRWVRRRLERRPGFAILFVTIFGSAFGISLVVATLARATIGTALPYPDAASVYALSETRPEEGIERMISSHGSYQDWADRTRTMASVGAVSTQVGTSLQQEQGAVRAEGAIVSRSMFEVLGVSPVYGRSFTEDEDRSGAGVTSVVLGHAFWTEVLGADQGVVGSALDLNGIPWTVVGILGEGVTLAPHYRERVDVWYPIGTADLFYGPPVYPNRAYRIFQLIGRLGEGGTESDLSHEVTQMTTAISEEQPGTSTGWLWRAEDLRSEVLRGVEGPIASLFLGGLVLFVVAVVNLLALFVHAVRRDLGELATRRALGAEVSDLLRLGLTELSALAFAGALGGLLIAAVGVHLFPLWLGLALPAYAVIEFDPVLVVGAFLLAQLLVVGLGFLAIAHAFGRLSPSLVVGGRVVGATPRGGRFSVASLGVQVALTTVLAIGSVVAARSFVRLGTMDPGIDAQGLTAFRVDVPPESRSDDEVLSTADEVLRRLEALPTVASAFLWSPHVPTAATWYTRVRLADRPEMDDSELPAVRVNSVSPGAVAQIGLDFLAGRDISQADRTSGRRVVVISESAAEAWWGSAQAALDKRIRRWNHEAWSDVIGVVADAPLSGRRGEGSDFRTDVYFLFGQDLQRNLVFMTRSPGGSMVDAAPVRGALRAAAPDLPAYDIRTMSARLADQDALSRSAALMGVIFAITAIVLASLGLYGGASVVLARRKRELGVRQALGASPVRVVTELVSRSSRVVLAGIAVGVVLAWYSLMPLDPTLFLVGPHDAFSYVIGVAVLLLAAMVALTIPSVRAVRSSPSTILRDS